MTRFSIRHLTLFFSLALLAACQTNVPSGLPQQQPAQLSAQETPDLSALPAPSGEVIGRGSVRVALLLPMSGQGTSAQVGREFRNAAVLAMDDVGLDAMQLVIKDTGSDANAVQSAASAAIYEGSSLVLGPVFASEVSAASAITRPAGKMMIAFSSDRNVAGPRVYLNSFLPGGVVARTLAHASQNGVTSVIGFFPSGAAGDVAERAARNTLRDTGGSLTAALRYEANEASVQQMAASAVPLLAQSQGILIPEGGPMPSAILAALRSNGGDLSGKRLLGTGQWTTANLADPALQGAWFADSDQARLSAFKSRYQAKFGTAPSANAALAYDTVVMAGTIVKRFGPAGLAQSVIEADGGYSGYAGVFRFEPDGTTERGYAIYEVGPGGATRVVSPSPRSFSGS